MMLKKNSIKDLGHTIYECVCHVDEKIHVLRSNIYLSGEIKGITYDE